MKKHTNANCDILFYIQPTADNTPSFSVKTEWLKTVKSERNQLPPTGKLVPSISIFSRGLVAMRLTS